jgi:N6-adenosine-specific RNA methylase IME4
MPWADEQYEQVTIKQAVAQLAGLETAYSTLGADTLELVKSRRYLEVRWGELLGDGREAQQSQNRRELSHVSESQLTKDDRHRFRQMAAAKDDVVELILTATDADELARSRILKTAKQIHPSEPVRTNAQGVYGALVIDPPWRYSNVATRGAAEDHYPTMSIPELLKLPEVCGPLAESIDSHAYLWTTAGMLREAFDLLRAWGYTYKTNLVWVKPQIGMGNYFRISHEHILFGVRGTSGRTRDRSLRSWFEAPRERHSRKPLAFYDLVEKASPGPYLDVFARDRRFGWDVWGNEA